MSRSGIAIILIIIGLFGFFIGSAWWTARSLTPVSVSHYHDLISTFAKEETIEAFLSNHPEVENESLYGCLEWMVNRMYYANPEIIKLPGDPCAWNEQGQILGRFPGERAEMPEDILNQKTDALGNTFSVALGRCGEFSLLYSQLLLAAGYKNVYLMMGIYDMGNDEIGDHVWIELELENGTLLVIDPTDAVTWKQNHYTSPWGECPRIKNEREGFFSHSWTWVYKISAQGAERITEKYGSE